MQSDVHEVVFDNGFKALLVERRGLPLVATQLYYQVGSRDERTGETGLAHFLEHMMFKGTDRFKKGEIDEVTARMGGGNNAWTSQDSTCYHFSLASDRWDMALEIEANRMRHCAFDPEELEQERKVILQEMAMGEDDPWRSLDHVMEGLLWSAHPYRHPIIGWRQDVETVSRDTMKAFYDRHYGPNRSFLVAVGDFSWRKVRDRLGELFGSLPQSAEERAPVLQEPQSRGMRRTTVELPGALQRFAIAFPTVRFGHRDDFVLDLISHELGGSRTSRLYDRLVLKDGLATEVYVQNATRLDPGMFWIAVELQPGADVDRVEAAVWEEVATLQTRAPAAGRLKRTRTQIRSSFLFEDETAMGQASKLGRFESEAEGGYKLLDTALGVYDEVGAADMKDTAKRLLTPERAVVVHALPAGQGDAAHQRLVSRGARPARKTAGKKPAKKKVAKPGAKKAPARKSAVRKKARKKVVARKVTQKKASKAKGRKR